jgi:hypothetical protein
MVLHSSVYKSGGKIPHRCIALLRYAFKHCEGLRGVDAEAFHDHTFRLADNVVRSQRRFELVFPLLIDKRNRGMIGEHRTHGSRLDRERFGFESEKTQRSTGGAANVQWTG